MRVSSGGHKCVECSCDSMEPTFTSLETEIRPSGYLLLKFLVSYGGALHLETAIVLLVKACERESAIYNRPALRTVYAISIF